MQDALETQASVPDSAMNLSIFRSVSGTTSGARLGQLALPGRKPVPTPNFFAATSRGVVPHVTPDNLARHDGLVCGAYVAFEDFIERNQKEPNRVPPLLQTAAKMPTTNTTTTTPKPPLHAFTALPQSIPTVLGARRMPPAACSLGNTADSVSVFTSTGVQTLTTAAYAQGIANLRPDIAVPMADLTFTRGTPSSKRAVRMAERTEEWMLKLRNQLGPGHGASGTAIFAPTLPVPHPIQWEYLRCLDEDVAGFVQGLAVHDVDILPDLDGYANLAALPRLSLDIPETPHDILRQVSLGADVMLLPIINAASETGVAFTFTFPAPLPAAGPLSLAVDLSSPEHRTSLAPLSPGCACAACTTHHAAYVHHLLDAHEMLAWTLLQLHNHAAAAAFFAGIRAVLARGPEAFDHEARRFAAVYEPAFPVGRAEPPRARGYNDGKGRAPGGPPPPRLNKPAWGRLGDAPAAAAATMEVVRDGLGLHGVA